MARPARQDQAEQRACYITLALVSIRRLFALRHSPRDGAEARSTLRKWAASLREMRAADVLEDDSEYPAAQWTLELNAALQWFHTGPAGLSGPHATRAAAESSAVATYGPASPRTIISLQGNRP